MKIDMKSPPFLLPHPRFLMAGIVVILTVNLSLKVPNPSLLGHLMGEKMSSFISSYWKYCFAFTTFIVVALVWYFLYGHFCQEYDRKTHSQVHHPGICRQIISGDFSHNRKRNHLTPVQSRGRPNRRLHTAFGIDSAFTSLDVNYVGDFVQKARQHVNLPPEKWRYVTAVVHETVAKWMENGQVPAEFQPGRHTGIQINLTALVQVLSLRIGLETMFDPRTRKDASDEDVLKLAQAINSTWIDSKHQDAIGDGITKFDENDILKDSLAALFYAPGERTGNPLNWILPSFETLWRIVLCAFIEIRFMTGLEQPEWSSVLTAFAKAPTGAQFELRPVQDALGFSFQNHGDSSTLSKCPSAKDIVMECLRLYPPTRRIYRAHCGRNSGVDSQYSMVAADIEACHLRKDIWGPDAETFNPHRLVSQTSEQKEAFMPFGARPFECPARAVFGPRMIGILVGGLLTALDTEPAKKMDWRVECKNEQVLKTAAKREDIGGPGNPQRSEVSRLLDMEFTESRMRRRDKDTGQKGYLAQYITIHNQRS
ncbi:Cytochrome P450 [Penicillium hispanicum]|uniref:Cytochrome P450 n=1 Tax=Penicillium hispanicum TaxID=1080232 RepID=UPI002540BCFB|nr:Cytochrome P450 [Penicillium hispanicum]KAJ5573392.1 Cytochrome P450 [Penicillium hispanicum]